MKKNYIALGGLFACLHVLFLLVSKVVLGSELLLVLFLPLLSTIYTLKSDRKSVIMFVIATLLICFVFDFINTFIYVVPSLMCGISYGALRKCKFKELELLCVSGLIHIVSIAFSFFVIFFIFKEVDFLKVFERIFSKEGEKLVVIALLSLIVLGFCEAFLVHMIAENELNKMNYIVEKNNTVPKWFVVPCFVSFFCYFILSLFDELYCVFPMIVFFIFFIPFIIQGMMNFKYKITTISLIIICFFVAIFLLRYLSPINYLILPIFIASPMVINNFKDNSEKNF